jgi:hypothetical protein
VLFTCLGSIARPMYDLGGPLPLRQGDKVMLCSDGLWDSIDDEAIVASLSALPVTQAVPALVEQALAEAGAHSDNVTVLAFEWEPPPAFANSGFTQTELMERDSFASTIQAVDVDPCSTSWTSRPSSAPSPRSTTPSSAAPPGADLPRPARWRPAPLFLTTAVFHDRSLCFLRPPTPGPRARRPAPGAHHPPLHRHAEGSVLIEFGGTRVLCTASVEEKVPPHKRGSGEGWVTAEYGMLPRATHTRSDREAARGKQSGARRRSSA